MTRRLAICLLLAAGLAAAQTTPLWPGVTYDQRIPTLKQTLGHEPGERITPHAGIVRYLEALAAASPRIKVFEYAQTWEGRRLVYAAVGSESNIARLDEIRAAMQRLADPRKTPAAEAKKLMASLPAVIWLGYGVHGNEISSPDAALTAAYHLVAARGDKMTDEILAKVVVLIDPLQNPDGRDRFVRNFEQNSGLEPDPEPLAAERAEPWPAGRTNHYYFDMNRDWFALTQPETRGRIKTLLEWYPLVFVDLHEMGTNSTYYFAPEADPFNPHLTKEMRDSLHWFGKNNAKWFDKFGLDYFTREVYDNFYPGYGASWPCYYGAIAMTYENASVRGLVVRRNDETLYVYRDSVRKHFITSLGTAETAAMNREKLLERFYQYRVSAIEEGSKEAIREYILPYRGDTSTVDKLAALLVEQGIEVKRARAAFKNGGKDYPAGSYVIPLAQPHKRMIRVLLDKDITLEAEFMKEQERRRRKKLGDEIYDVTAWSMPLLFNAEAVAAGETSAGSFDPVRGAPRIPPGKISGKAEVAYVAPWGSAASGRLLAAALRDGLRVLSSDKPFRLNGRQFPAGSLIFKTSDNENLHPRLERLAAASGAEVVATNTSYVDDGVNFGSRYVQVMKKARILMAWDTPTGANAAGATRFVLERQFGYPVTVVRTQQLANVDLRRYDTLILPGGFGGGGYAQVLGENGIRRIKDWVAAGGTIIGLGGAVGFLADNRVQLLATQAESLPRAGETPREAPRPPAAPSAPGSAPAAGPPEQRAPGKLFAKEEDYLKAIEPDSAPPDGVLGVLARAKPDPDHWLTAGVAGTVNVLVEGSAVYTPLKLDRGINAMTFLGPDDLLASGYLWEENRKQLAYKPFVMVQRSGQGHVIGFTADPNYRAYMDGLNVLFLNAVFRGPAHSR